MYKGLIEPHFDYCSALWDGLTQQLSEKLQNRAISSGGKLDDGKTEISGKIVFGIGAKGIFLQLLLVFFFANLTALLMKCFTSNN